VPTVRDILASWRSPAATRAPDFKVARFNDGVEDIKDLQPGMMLEGTVSNVAQFGAFVDLGVHQDGLVHVSQLANKFVKDAREVVKTGDIVKVKVLEVDVARKRRDAKAPHVVRPVVAWCVTPVSTMYSSDSSGENARPLGCTKSLATTLTAPLPGRCGRRAARRSRSARVAFVVGRCRSSGR
jgi:transcriptional accessory protein Tex/SPT6